MIGLFDSGVGGLSVLREVRTLLPDADLVYLADQARAPFGDRSLDEVGAAAEEAAVRLIEMGAGTIAVACNTASAAALHQLRRKHPGTPFVGMEPAVKPAAAATSSGIVGVLATPTTFQAEVFDQLVGRFADGIRVIPHPCPGWAAMVEEHGTDADFESIRGHVAPLVAEGVDTLVLACTHYSFLTDSIARAAGPGVAIIDPAPAVAHQVARVAGSEGAGTTTYLTTGDPARFAAQIESLLGARVDAGVVTR